MAAAPVAMTPPPSANGVPSGTSTPVASPAPPQPNPTMQQGTSLAIQVARNLQTIAKAFPSTAQIVAQMNNQLRDLVSEMMQDAEPPEPAAPPQG